MKVLINKQTNLVEGINSPSTPFNYSIEVRDDFNLTKTIELQKGEVQKTNEEGIPLYTKEVYRTESKEIITGKEEVLEDTGVPVIIVVQKTDEQGNKLYLESLYDEQGELIDCVEVTNEFNKDDIPNDPIFIEVQKKSVKGKPLYYKDIVKTIEEQIFDHVEETTEITEQPIMLPNMVKKIVHFKSDYKVFTGEDIIQAKYQEILEESQKDYMLGDMFIDVNNLDLADEKHSANTGVALLQLLPKGQVKTKTIGLAVPTTEFVLLDFVADNGIEVYLSGKKFVDGKLTLASPISNCTIKFVNTTDKHVILKSYAIGY